LAINIILESESENEIIDLNVDIKPKKNIHILRHHLRVSW
jgi:hypothetical protein